MADLIKFVFVVGMLAVIVVCGLAATAFYNSRPAVAEAQAQIAQAQAQVAQAEAEASVDISDRWADFLTVPLVMAITFLVVVFALLLGAFLRGV